MAIFTPPPAVPQRGDRATFSGRVDAFLTWLAGLIPQLTAFLAQLTTLAAGGAYSLPYTVDTSTGADADPGAGNIRFNLNASQATSTILRMSTSGASGAMLASLIDTFDDSTSSIRGHFRLCKLNDPSAFIVFAITGISGTGAYRNITGSVVNASSTNPFGAADAVLAYFQRTGDKGEVGSGYYNLMGQATVTTPVSTIDFLNIFNSQYDRYVIELQGVAHGAGDSLVLRLAKTGSPDTSSTYIAARGDAVTTASANSTLVQLCNNSSANVTVTVDVRNANATSGIKPIGVRGVNYDVGASNYSPIIKEGAYLAANAVSGFRIFWQGGGNVTGGTVRVYGVKNSA